MKIEQKWKVGQMARYITHSCVRMLIVGLPKKLNHGSYICLSSSGTVCWHTDEELLTLEEWLTWFDRFQDELTGKQFREYRETAQLEFNPPPWWDEAVQRATGKL